MNNTDKTPTLTGDEPIEESKDGSCDYCSREATKRMSCLSPENTTILRDYCTPCWASVKDGFDTFGEPPALTVVDL